MYVGVRRKIYSENHAEHADWSRASAFGLADLNHAGVDENEAQNHVRGRRQLLRNENLDCCTIRLNLSVIFFALESTKFMLNEAHIKFHK